MKEGTPDVQSVAPMSSTDMLQRKTIDYVFSLCLKACSKEEPISKDSYETGFIRGVRLAKSLLWKYMDEKIKSAIRELYVQMDNKFKDIEKLPNLNKDNKTMNKMLIADDISMQILELCLVVLFYSPMSTEYKEIAVFGDMQELAKSIRVNEPVKLFATELEA